MKRDELISEILAAHADHLNQENTTTETYLSMFPDDRDSLAPLLELAAQLKSVLAPASMTADSRDQLQAELLETGTDILSDSTWRSRINIRSRLPERLSELPVLLRFPDPPGRQTLVRAAAGGAGLAAAGVAAYVIRDRFFESTNKEEIPLH